jgi:hypothetical protein
VWHARERASRGQENQNSWPGRVAHDDVHCGRGCSCCRVGCSAGRPHGNGRPPIVGGERVAAPDGAPARQEAAGGWLDIKSAMHQYDSYIYVHVYCLAHPLHSDFNTVPASPFFFPLFCLAVSQFTFCPSLHLSVFLPFSCCDLWILSDREFQIFSIFSKRHFYLKLTSWILKLWLHKIFLETNSNLTGSLSVKQMKTQRRLMTEKLPVIWQFKTTERQFGNSVAPNVFFSKKHIAWHAVTVKFPDDYMHDMD